MNQRLMGLSPWAYATVMASFMAAGTGIGIIIGRAAAGGRILDVGLLAGVGAGWLGAFLVGRLIAPAAQASMRQHQQWRTERREQGKPESSAS